jgi:4'-phosphopantetheinyl transferase
VSVIDELRTSADLWLLPESDVDLAVADHGAKDILSAAERARHERLRDPRARRLYLGGRLLVRYVLAAHTGSPPRWLEFQAGPYGRPELVPNPDELRFNLSHTTGLIGCVITRGRGCGLDLERSPVPQDLARLLSQFLSEEESRHLTALGDERSATALQYWVVKEAYLKALGAGLSRPLETFTIRGLGTDLVSVDDRQQQSLFPQIELQQITSDHVAALALLHGSPGRRIPIRIIDFSVFLRAAAAPAAVTPPEGDAPGRAYAANPSRPDRKEHG